MGTNQDQPRDFGPDIARGVCRLLRALGQAAVTEVTLANGRRADVVGLDRAGAVLIVEVKSSLADFRSDGKWHEYRDFCDAFAFAVPPDFPVEVLPDDCGLILADRFGGEVVRPATGTPLPAARRKAMLIRLARVAADRLLFAGDPQAGAGPLD